MPNSSAHTRSGIRRYRVALLAFLALSMVSAISAFGPQTTDLSGKIYLPVATDLTQFSMTPVGSGFNTVTEVTHAGDDRLFVAERAGLVKILHPNGQITPFLDIRNRVISHRGEYGFFDIAFHPGYANPASVGYGLFYVSYTTGFDDGMTLKVDFIVSRFRVTANPDVADPTSEVIIVREKQGFDAHKGGGMEFDPRDEMLYVGVGDDRQLLIAQLSTSPKGKIIRLDVNKVPPDFTGDDFIVADEIWAYGLRNPWRFDLDIASNQIYIGEVGDYLWEEVNLASLNAPGFNFGWPCIEGPFVIPEASDIPECQNPHLFQRGIHEYPHKDGSGRCAVIGGKVNRPDYNPNDGRYIFADMCTREVFSLSHVDGNWERTLLGILPGELISTIGEDRHGFQYIGTVSVSGPIYKLYIP